MAIPAAWGEESAMVLHMAVSRQLLRYLSTQDTRGRIAGNAQELAAGEDEKASNEKEVGGRVTFAWRRGGRRSLAVVDSGDFLRRVLVWKNWRAASRFLLHRTIVDVG